MEYRWLLANKKDEDAVVLDAWVLALPALLHVEGWIPAVTSAKDDFFKRAAGLAGFPSWIRSCATGTTFDGSPRFHGMVVPIDEAACWGPDRCRAPRVGRGTYDLVAQFLRAQKYVYAWDTRTGLERVQWAEKLTPGTMQEYAVLQRVG